MLVVGWRWVVDLSRSMQMCLVGAEWLMAEVVASSGQKMAG
jgi:hypothetical protein